MNHISVCPRGQPTDKAEETKERENKQITINKKEGFTRFLESAANLFSLLLCVLALNHFVSAYC